METWSYTNFYLVSRTSLRAFVAITTSIHIQNELHEAWIGYPYYSHSKIRVSFFEGMIVHVHPRCLPIWWAHSYSYNMSIFHLCTKRPKNMLENYIDCVFDGKLKVSIVTRKTIFLQIARPSKFPVRFHRTYPLCFRSLILFACTHKAAQN